MRLLSNFCFASFLFLLGAQQALAQFGEPVLVSGSSGNVGEQVLFADVDQDGVLDLITLPNYSDAIKWYRQYEPEQYGVGRIALEGLQNPTSFGYTDLNGDGVADLVVATQLDGQIVWAKNNGFGEFAIRDTLAMNLTEASYFRTADLDGDGDMDIVVACTQDSRIVWFANDGSGNFGPQQDITTSATGIKKFDVGDMDNDGDLDILFFLPGEQSLGWCANNGSGGFGPITMLGSGFTQQNTATITDLNGDGLADVILTTNTGLNWMAGMGTGAFGVPQTISTSSIARFAWPGDLNGDGHIDLLVSLQFGTFLYLNNGDATFTEMLEVLGPYAVDALLQDLNGDALPDIAMLLDMYKVSYLMNLGNGIFGDMKRVPQSVQATMVVPADMDGDGDIDLMVRQSQYSPVIWLSNEGAEGFHRKQEFFSQGNPVNHFYLQDFDQDGWKDLLYIAGTTMVADLYWQRNVGAGVFAPEALLATSYLGNYWSAAAPSQIVEADLDGDGLLDHLVTYPNLGWRKKSSTTFGPHQTIDAGLTNAILAVADLDGDGDMDVIAVERSSSTITRWYRNDGSGSFTQEPLPTTDDFAVKIHVFDADGDGDLDIAVTNSFSTLDLLFNDGNEVFTLVTLNSGWQNYNGEIAILDVDRDGDLDIVAGYDPGLMWYSNDGLGVFTSQGPLSPAIGTNSNVMTAIDMDQDGAEDLIVLQGLGPSISIIPNIASNYYRIQGRVYFDLDDDGVRDPGEPPVPWIPVVATPASNFPIAMNNGTFLCYVDSGTFTVHPIIDTMLWRISGDSAQYTIHLDANNSVSTGNNFGITANAPGSIVHLGLVTGQAVCADTTYHTITYRNLGNREEHGTISFDMGPLHTILDSEPPPDSVVANRYYWSFDDLFFYETRTIRVHDILPNSTYLGQTAFMHLELITQDELGNNKDTVVVNHNAVVLCSYDPNDKQVSPRGYGDHGAVDIATGHLDYTIRFQNTGNAAAYTVTLRDTLPAEVRPTSVQVLGYSFSPTDVRVDTAGALMIKFQGINLPDSASDNAGSQGFITFRLGLQEGLPHLTTITNSAGIYFDLNPPVITNQTLTTLVDCDLWTPAVQNTVTNVLSATTGDRYQWFLDGFPLPDSDVQELVISQSGAYSVEVTSIYGCIALSEALAVIADGVQEHAPFNFQLAPNPASNLVQLTCDEILTREHVVDLLDISGKVLLTQHGNGSNVLSIILPKTASGNYVIRLTSSKGDRVSQPLIVR